MNLEQEEYLAKLKVYYDQRIANFKKDLADRYNDDLIRKHQEALRCGYDGIVELNNNRLKAISKYKDTFSLEKFASLMIKQENQLFNKQLDLKEEVVNFHYNNLLSRGHQVEKLDLSAFKVDENDGL